MHKLFTFISGATFLPVHGYEVNKICICFFDEIVKSSRKNGKIERYILGEKYFLVYFLVGLQLFNVKFCCLVTSSISKTTILLWMVALTLPNGTATDLNLTMMYFAQVLI